MGPALESTQNSSAMGTTGDAQSPPLTTSAAAARATSRAASPSPAPAPAPAPGPSVSPPPPSFRRGKWHQAEYEEVWRLGHTYILTLSSSSSSSSPSPSPSSSIATPPPSTAAGTGAGSVQDWENLRLHPEGLMKTQARQRSASALRSMFLKMRKESLLQQATAATTTTTEHPQIRKNETGGDPSSSLRGASLQSHPILSRRCTFLADKPDGRCMQSVSNPYRSDRVNLQHESAPPPPLPP